MTKEVATPIRTIRIGSSAEADLVLAEESISPTHAELAIFSDQVLFLVDLESESGTYIYRNGSFERHEQGEVTSRDIVRFGGTEITVGEIISVFSIPEADVTGGQPAVSVRVRSWNLWISPWHVVQKHPRVVVGSFIVLGGLAGWSYQCEWETYNSIDSQLELARGRIQDKNSNTASREALRALLSDAQDRAIVSQCFWSCDIKMSLADEGARLERLLSETGTSAERVNPPS